MAKRKTRATPAQLVDWRIGHHVEAAGAMVSDALNRVAAAMEQRNRLQAMEVDLRREHLMAVLESKATADRAAQRLLGMVPDMGRGGFFDLRDVPKGRDPHDEERRGPDWVKDVLTEDGGKPS